MLLSSADPGTRCWTIGRRWSSHARLYTGLGPLLRVGASRTSGNNERQTSRAVRRVQSELGRSRSSRSPGTRRLLCVRFDPDTTPSTTAPSVHPSDLRQYENIAIKPGTRGSSRCVGGLASQTRPPRHRHSRVLRTLWQRPTCKIPTMRGPTLGLSRDRRSFSLVTPPARMYYQQTKNLLTPSPLSPGVAPLSPGRLIIQSLTVPTTNADPPDQRGELPRSSRTNPQLLPQRFGGRRAVMEFPMPGIERPGPLQQGVVDPPRRLPFRYAHSFPLKFPSHQPMVRAVCQKLDREKQRHRRPPGDQHRLPFQSRRCRHVGGQ